MYFQLDQYKNALLNTLMNDTVILLCSVKLCRKLNVGVKTFNDYFQIRFLGLTFRTVILQVMKSNLFVQAV